MLKKLSLLLVLSPFFFALPVLAVDPGGIKDVAADRVASAGSAVKKAVVMRGTISSITGNNMVLVKNSENWTVMTDVNTKFLLRYGGKATLKDFSVNDQAFVFGKATDSANTVQSRVVRDLSVGRQVFLGKVTGSLADGWTIDTPLHGKLTVTLATTAKLTNRIAGTITAADVKVGDWLRVGGIYTKKNSTVQAEKIKDYTQPVKTTGAATPSAQTP